MDTDRERGLPGGGALMVCLLAPKCTARWRVELPQTNAGRHSAAPTTLYARHHTGCQGITMARQVCSPHADHGPAEADMRTARIDR